MLEPLPHCARHLSRLLVKAHQQAAVCTIQLCRDRVPVQQRRRASSIAASLAMPSSSSSVRFTTTIAFVDDDDDDDDDDEVTLLPLPASSSSTTPTTSFLRPLGGGSTRWPMTHCRNQSVGTRWKLSFEIGLLASDSKMLFSSWYDFFRCSTLGATNNNKKKKNVSNNQSSMLRLSIIRNQ